MVPPCLRGEKNPTPDEISGVRYENVFHGSTLLARLTARRSCPLEREVPSQPTYRWAAPRRWLCSGNRQEPLAANGGSSLLSFPVSVLFDAFFQIRGHYTTSVCLCQGDSLPVLEAFSRAVVAGLMPGPGGGCGRRPCQGDPPPIFFCLDNRKRPRPVKRKPPAAKRPSGAYLPKYGGRANRSGGDRWSRRPCAFPRQSKNPVPASDGVVRGRGGHRICLYFYLRAFRFAGRCRGNC